MKFLLTTIALIGLPLVSFAADTGTGAGNFLGGGNGGELGTALETIVQFLNDVVVPFLLAIGFFVLVWGIIKYFVIGGDNDDAKASGRSLILYAIAGFVVILAFWGIVNIISGGIGLEGDSLDTTPTVTVGGGAA